MGLIDDMPVDWRYGRFLGRLLLPAGPTPVLVDKGQLVDISRGAPTSAHAIALAPSLSLVGEQLGELETLQIGAEGVGPKLLSPLDLQCVKASGVTFAVSAVERVIEERAGGDAQAAQALRKTLADRIGSDLSSVRPGSKDAARLKAVLIEAELWSQYLEVAIGPDAEIFTKAPVLATVGWGDPIGVRSDSDWNNPEPEVVLVCGPNGRPVGASLGNDVNLRDFEGRSALLLGKAKDNNASAAIGPFIRLFDETFSLDDVRQAEVSLSVTGKDGFTLAGQSSMRLISRDPLELAAQTFSAHHQYPDGFALYLGTMFAPIEDRDTPGGGFTHKDGDEVCISSPRLGTLRNRVTSCEQAPPWTMGIMGLIANLSSRGLL